MRSEGKRVIIISLCLILVLSVFFSCFFSTYAYGNEVPQTASVTEVIYDGARYIDFNDNWKFYLATRTPTPIDGDVTKGLMDPEGAPTTNEIIDPAFDDSSWRTLNVPHDWSIEGEKVPNANNSQGYLQGGLGWYRKTFTLPNSLSEKKVFIDFEGVYAHSIVYVNGKMVGEYPNGYTGFSYEITPYVTFGPDNPNVIVVKVMNMAPSGRWYTGSGIVNPVNLVVTDKTFFLRHGITYKTSDLENTYNEDGSATLDVKAEIYSDAPNGVAYIKTTVYDAEGNVAAEPVSSQVVDYNPSTKLTLNSSVTVPDVHLWSVDDPYLYTIRTELYTMINGGDGEFHLSDYMDTRYGFRWFEFKDVDTTSPETIANSGGFYLNGEYMKLQGVDLHHDNGALGAAFNRDAVLRKFKILKEMGVNAFRTSHNPVAKGVIDVCEELGIVVMEEAFDGWGSQKATYDFGRWFLKEVPENWAGSILPLTPATPGARVMWSDWVIQEMVNRDKNSPAVIMWSIGNEIRGVGSKPGWMDLQGMFGVDRFDEYSEAIRLSRDILAIDSTRPIVMGGDQERNPPTSSSVWGKINNLLDGYGLNYNTAESVDVLITRYPQTFFFESESSSQTGARGVYLDPSLVNTGVNQTPGSRGTSGYDNNFASWTMGNEYGLKKDRDRKAFAGQFIWSGFDYIGEPTPYSIYPVGVSSFGCVDTAGFPKDSYYLFKSQWNPEPMAHIVPMNWNNWRPGEIVEVWVNTNQQSAELFLNGKSLGRKSFDVKTTNYGKQYYETSEPTQDNKNNTSSINTGGYVSPNGEYGKLHLTWYVPFEPGVLEVKAYPDPTSDVVTATDVIKTAGQPYTVKMKPDKQVILADGRSLCYIECDIVDKDGNMIPDAKNLVKFDVAGGAIVGVDNGQQESKELYKWGNVERNTHSERSAYNGKVLVIVQSNKDQAGPITVKASFDGSLPAQTTIFAKSEDATGVIGILPVNVHVKKGEELSLPSEVTVVNADGTTSQSPVTWNNVPSTGQTGTFQATATVNGVQAVANVTVYDFASANVDIEVPIGVIPALPENVKVIYSNGLAVMTPVTWSGITPDRVGAEGTFVVTGQIEGMTNEATAAITVSGELQTGTNIARIGEGVGVQDIYSETSPLATATFTAGASGSVNYYPNNMLDGNYNTLWTNSYSISATAVLPAVNNSRPYEFVQVYWPEYVTFDTIKLYFRTGNIISGTPSANMPASLDVQYWNGVEWVSAGNQLVEWAAASNQATTITFDKITTTKVRVGMENGTPYSKQTGNMAITEFEVYYNGVNDIEKVEAPTASPESGTYIGAQTIVLSTATEGAEIYYTTDGSIPTAESTKYEGPIVISEDTTIKAIAIKAGYEDSDVAEFNYVIISLSTPVIQCDGPDAVPEGEEFVVGLIIDNLDLDSISEYVYAADITVNYDTNLFEFVAGNKVSDKTVLCEIKEENGSIHIILSNNEAITSGEKLVNLTFKAKDDIEESAAGTIQVKDVMLGTSPSGLVINAEGATITVTVNKEPAVPAIDLTGQDSVDEEEEFDVNLVLTNVDDLSEAVYAVDITIKYDTDLFEFISGSEASEKTNLFELREKDGSIQIVLSSEEAITSNEILANLKFKAKDVDESTSGSIQIEKALLGTAPSGLVISADGDTLTVNVNKEPRIPGDVNGDGVINVGDLAVTAYYYAVEEGDPNWNAAKAADTNNDGVIDLKDLIFIARKILQ
ncbi:MAG TPA: DUF4982 domain-containing protein [Clostridiaceae bacterium]|nr:DUF4982 domain-containing protein [Clostridiaceae bacterium]